MNWLALVVVSLALIFAPTLGHAADIDKGKSIFAARCAFCHGSSGKGDGPAGAALKPPPTNFTAPEYWKTASLDHVKEVILNGKPGTPMVPFKGTLSPEQVDDVATYLQTLKQ